MKVFIVFGFVTIAISAVCSMTIDDISEEWNLFKIKFNKEYKDVGEELFRKNMYLKNKIKVEKHNKLYRTGQVTYKLGMNQFSDMDQHEIASKIKGFNKLFKNDNKDGESVSFTRSKNDIIPNSIDWRYKGAVTPVKDQKFCGSCWAFSSTGALEGQHFIKTGELLPLSEQNLIDCTKKYGNQGCNGGYMDNSFKYVKDNDGIDSEDTYPYKEKTGHICKYRSRNKGATSTGFVDITSGDENALKEAVATVGPISVGIDASSTDFYHYKEGVFYLPSCNTTELDHAILVVGYNTTESGDDYWIAKNSWGRGWGQHGYIWMARNKNNNCGIATMASYPLA